MARILINAQTDIKYRYTCEGCGDLTEWNDALIRQTSFHSFNAGNRFKKEFDISPNSLSLSKEELLSNFNDTVDYIKNCIAADTAEINMKENPLAAELYNDALTLGKACPTCGKKQSWYPAHAEDTPLSDYIKVFGILSAVGGFFPALLISPFLFPNVANTLLSFFYTEVLIILVGLLVGYLYAVGKEEKRRDQIAQNDSARQRPEIEWGEPQIIDLGVAQ